jgi:hypothetical protein
MRTASLLPFIWMEPRGYCQSGVEGVGPVEIVDSQRLLEPGRVRCLGEGDQPGVVVQHQVPTHVPAAVAESLRVPVARRGQQQGGGVDRTGRHDDDVGGVLLALAVAVDHHPADAAPGRVGLQADHAGAGPESDGAVPQGRLDGHHLGVRLAPDQAREAVAGGAADARGQVRLPLIEQDAVG